MITDKQVYDKDLKQSFITEDTRDTNAQETFGISKSFISTKKDDRTCDYSIVDDVYEDPESVVFNFKSTLKYAPAFYLQSIPLMFNRMNPYLLNLCSLVFIAFFGNALYTAAFGLGNAIFMFFWQTFTQVNGETQGINCSKAFGAGDYKLMRLSFFRGFFWNILITLLACVLYTNIAALLIAAGFDPKMATLAQEMVTSILPALMFQTVNEMIRNYLMSQKVVKPFLWINLVTFIFFPIGGYFFIYKSGWGVLGFGLLKFVVELISMIGLIVLMKKYSHPEALRRESLKEIFIWKEYKQYMRDYGKILMGWYASYFGLEVNTILCGITGDPIIMACWVSFMNLFAIIWTIGTGQALVTRTKVSMLIGSNQPLMAKKYTQMGFILALILSVVEAVIICCFSSQIAGLFSTVPAVLVKLKYQVFLMGLLTLMIGVAAMNSTTFRVINKAGLYSVIMLVNQVLLMTGFSSIALFVWNLGAAGGAYAFLLSWTLTFFIATYYYNFKFDWNTLKKKMV